MTNLIDVVIVVVVVVVLVSLPAASIEKLTEGVDGGCVSLHCVV